MAPFLRHSDNDLAASALLRGLLRHDPGDRFGASDVKQDPFFKSVDWAAVGQKKMRPTSSISAYVGLDNKVSTKLIDHELVAKYFHESTTKCGTPLNSRLSNNKCDSSTFSLPLRDVRVGSSNSSTRTEPTLPSGNDSTGPLRGFMYNVDPSQLLDIGHKL